MFLDPPGQLRPLGKSTSFVRGLSRTQAIRGWPGSAVGPEQLADAVSSELGMSQGWLNNRAQLFLKQEFHGGLYSGAKTVLLKARGLKV